MSRPKAWISWSSGKDSAWALDVVQRLGVVEVTGLLTTINQTHRRVAMHAVREELLDRQAQALNLPLVKVLLPYPCSNRAYEAAMAKALGTAASEGITRMIFGDLFLEDVRRYREEHLAGTGIEPMFPLWGVETAGLARRMIEAGLRAVITCLDPKKLDRSFAGRTFDRELIDQLAHDVDPCGENGEFHTFACGGPMFERPLNIMPGEVVERDGFVFADLLPCESGGQDECVA